MSIAEAFESNLSQLLEFSSGVNVEFKIGKDLEQRLTGRFYTHERIGRLMAKELAAGLVRSTKTLRIIDPFCGDGRLVHWLLGELREIELPELSKIYVALWDCDEKAVTTAAESVGQILLKNFPNTKFELDARKVDSFAEIVHAERTFDICITNPPWETIKPDSRELSALVDTAKDAYIALLKEKVIKLEKAFPHSKPTRKFSGWGANLARCGIEASVRLVCANGHFGIVAPASIFGDQISAPLRTWLMKSNRIPTVHHYPAESRLFEGVDQAAVYFLGEKDGTQVSTICVVQHPKDVSSDAPPILNLDFSFLESHGFAMGFTGSSSISAAMPFLKNLSQLGDFEDGKNGLLRLGRELDETGIASKLSKVGRYRFVKGRNISRFSFDGSALDFLSPELSVPASADTTRVVWRDVARQSSVRRMIATLMPPGNVTGNSLNVLSVKTEDISLLNAIMGLFNSVVFEAQVRATISTNHLSVGAIRKIRVPNLNNVAMVKKISLLMDNYLENKSNLMAAKIDVAIAEWYGIPFDIYELMLDQLEMNAPEEVVVIRQALSEIVPVIEAPRNSEARIPNHYASTLSELDLVICHAVPPGGNWKNIPESVPSLRISNIRKSFAEGGGSRSTYYGRLHPDRPSYTMNTYFTRPGNGCHIHYDYEGGQHRTLSQREAARLQSFPDNFEFKGSKTSIGTQIGNAVPPLLAYQVARHIPIIGQTIDLFAGAGGLGLGFSWNGWKTLTGNELESSFSETYKANVHHDIVVGDIRDSRITGDVVARAKKFRNPDLPLCVLGGPPCQGFSTAGNKRSMEDERNWLFEDYCGLLAALEPDVFVFENVTGILNMDGGRAFKMIKDELGKYAKRLIVWKLHSENYAIPQRRSRVIIIGDNTGQVPEVPPPMLSTMTPGDLVSNLPLPPSVREALDDLPRLNPGEDGSLVSYRHEPISAYQEFMRGRINAVEYLNRFTR